MNYTFSNKELFSANLPTRPIPEIGKILITGASGYIGGRLVPELLWRGYNLRIMVRGDKEIYEKLWPSAEVVVADALSYESLNNALSGVAVAYYLIHSLQLGPRDFNLADIKAAANFARAAEENKVQRIIYLGGLGDIRSSLSSHLRSRMEVASELRKSKVKLTVLRAAIIIGSGSASYEIIKHLVRRLPIILIPRWARNRCQPIAVRDVIKYLVAVLETPETAGRSFDIGGEDILTYEKMLKILAGLLKRRTLFVPFFISYIPFYSYFASLLTPVPNNICRCLMEGLRNEVVCQDEEIRKIINFKPISYRESIVRALSREEQDRISTRWSDAYPPAYELSIKLAELKGKTKYKASYSLLTLKSKESLFNSFCAVGGKRGWFHSNWMWRMRGMIDRIFLGVGSLRGRRSYSELKVGDVVDFWRVEDIVENERLLLRAEMKIPGKAWLEFMVTDKGNKRKLTVTAYYDTNSLWGKIYWYLCLPFHHFIFTHLIEGVERRSNF